MWHWINVEFWGPVWPNLAASSVCATLAVLKVKAHMKAHHETIRGEIEKLRKRL